MGRLAALLGWFRSYLPLWLVVGLSLVVSFPGWYTDQLVQSIMTNVFATFAVTPVLVFGVEKVLRRVEDLRERPRKSAAIEEIAASVSGVVSSLAAIRSIDTVLPGTIAKMSEGFPRPTEVSDQNARFMSDLLVNEVVGRQDEVEHCLGQMSLADLEKLMKAAGEQAGDLRARLFEAGNAIRPELHVRVVKLLRDLHRVGRNADLATYIVERGYRPTNPEAEAGLHHSFVRLYMGAVLDAASIYRDLPSAP